MARECFNVATIALSSVKALQAKLNYCVDFLAIALCGQNKSIFIPSRMLASASPVP